MFIELNTSDIISMLQSKGFKPDVRFSLPCFEYSKKHYDKESNKFTYTTEVEECDDNFSIMIHLMEDDE